MFAGRDFSPQENDESEVLELDFVNDMDSGETVTSSIWTLIVVAGIDPNPNSHLEGPSMPAVPKDGSLQTATIQRVGGILPGVTYVTHAQVVTSLGNTRNLYSHIRGVSVI